MRTAKKEQLGTSPLGTRVDAIEALASVSNNPARKRVPQQVSSPQKSAAAWTQAKMPDGAAALLAPPEPSRVPRVSQPLRVEPPSDYNAPARAPRLGGTSGRHSLGQALTSKLARRALVGAPTAKSNPDKMKDYAVLASACARAGRQTRAAHLIFNQGVLYENMGEVGSALRCYKELLRASLEAGDPVGEALACNCIGVAMQLRADEQSLAGAIQYHTQHLAVADVPGKFIAHCNLGLAHAALGHINDATAHHQHALRYAIRMSSLAGESLACGHLGMLGDAADVETSKACVERQLQLARTLHDHRGQEDAFMQLGGLAQKTGQYGEASEYFAAALEEAQVQRDGGAEDMARVSLGLASGVQEFESFLAQAQQAP